jgi:hypothetical protein
MSSSKDQSFDYVLTVCDSAKESCPTFPNQSKRIHMGFEDAAAFQDTEQERLALSPDLRFAESQGSGSTAPPAAQMKDLKVNLGIG